VPDSRPPFDVIILAGGRGARLGGADKPGLVVGSSTMAATAARAAATAGARRIILVGPGRPDVTAAVDAAVPPVADLPASHAPDAGVPDTAPWAGVRWAGRLVVTREEPPGAGPVPGLRAGLAEVAAPWVAVLAADLPFLDGDRVLSLLAAARDAPSAGAVIADETGREQWLAGCWRTGRLAAALDAYEGSSLRGLLAPLRPALIRDAHRADGPPPWLDCDTPDELAAARAWLAARETPPSAAGPASAVPGPGPAD
jgi:molybdopterin-guanine dinucleotide biosynthesis protein A